MGKVLKGIKTIVGVGGAIANMTTSNPADITPSQYAKLQSSTEIARAGESRQTGGSAEKYSAYRQLVLPTDNRCGDSRPEKAGVKHSHPKSILLDHRR